MGAAPITRARGAAWPARGQRTGPSRPGARPSATSSIAPAAALAGGDDRGAARLLRLPRLHRRRDHRDGAPDFIGLDNYATRPRGCRVLERPFCAASPGRSAGRVLQTVLAFAAALAAATRRFTRAGASRAPGSCSRGSCPTIVIAILWRWMLNADLRRRELRAHRGRARRRARSTSSGSPQWALPTVISINAWRWFPFLAAAHPGGASAAYPREYYEAARIDGASRPSASPTSPCR